MTIPDVQDRLDGRGIALDRVGIQGLQYPITILDREKGEQKTIAEIYAAVNLSAKAKGTHMSRFIEILNEYKDSINLHEVPQILERLQKTLESQRAFIGFKFPYFIRKKAPVTKKESILSYLASIEGALNINTSGGIGKTLTLSVDVPITTLCPCSKEISSYGAHNQRAIAAICITQYPGDDFLWLEELIEYAEQSASCEIYPLLKREDEKFVTEKAYDKPMFVEDVARALAQRLQGDQRIRDFGIEIRSMESIHAHLAFAQLIRRQSE